MFINQILTKLKSLVYSKSETDSLLNGKASSSHTHTKSQISDFPTIPSKTSQLTNDSGFITGVSWANVSGKPSTFTPSSHTHTKSQITDFPSLATVATSGSYNDLSNKPSIPSIDLRPQASADANTVSDGVSITHYGSNGPSTSLGASTDDGALFQQCWSSAWKVQIAADYRNGNLFTRGKNNGTWQPWRAVAYHSDNVSKFTNDSGYITSSGSCNYANSAGYASSAGSAGEVNTSVAAGSTKNLIYAAMADNDQCRIMCGGASNAGYMEIATSDDGNEPIYVRQYNNGTFGSIVRTLTLLDGSGNTQFPGTVTAPTFSGNLNGNCSGTAGGVAWTNVSGRPWALSQFTNDSGYITTDGAAYPRRVGGVTMNFNWSGQGGQPTWLWGGEDGTNMYVYNPANFSVNYANNSGYTNWLRTSSHSDHLLHTEWDGGYFWTYVTAGDGGYRPVRVERSNSSGYADSAGGVAWGNVSGRPWAVSQLTNDSGFITSEIDSSGTGWVRFKSGIQICYGSVNNTNGLGTGKQRISFPKAFNAKPNVIVTPDISARYIVTANVEDTTTWVLNTFGAYGSPIDYVSDPLKVNYVAIGT